MNVIMKFGGTSVADAEAMGRVLGIVRRQLADSPRDKPPVVVVSAMSKVTDRLIETGRLAGEGDAEGAARLLGELLERHLQVAGGLIGSDGALAGLAQTLRGDFSGLTGEIRRLAAAGEVPPRAVLAMMPRGILGFIFMIAIFYGWIWAIEKNRDSSLGVGLMLGFTFFLGLLLAPLLSRILGMGNGASLVALAAGGTAAVFFAMAGIATTTKRDFSSMAKFLVAGVVVAMVLVVANAFFQSPAMHLAILAIFIPLSAMLMLYQINQVVRGGETNYISAALSIYISIYNLFSSLLQLLGIFGSSDD